MTPAAIQIPIVSIKQAALRPRILIEVFACVAPAMTLVGLGQITNAATLLFGSVLLLLAWHFVHKERPETVALIIGTTPALMLLRGYFYYSALPVIVVYTFFMQLWSSPVDSRRFRKNGAVAAFLGGCTVYWLASVIATGNYSSNIRLIEFAFAAANVWLLAGRRAYLGSALSGIAISMVAVAIGLMPYGPRLGEGAIDNEVSIGNPISLGLSAALILLLTIADRGTWLLVQSHLFRRTVMNAAAGAALVLSTSRGSWLVTISALLLILVLNRTARKPLLISLLVFSTLLLIILQTDRGPIVKHYFDEAVSDDSSLAKRTTGRADQWESFPRIFNDSPLWGFGPGSGKKISLQYTLEGKPWHSLYLHVGTELGLFGLVLVALLIGTLLYKSWIHYRLCHEVVPLLGIVCFAIVGVSVTGIDPISGIYLGLSFAGMEHIGWHRVVRRQVDHESALRGSSALGATA